MGPHRCKLDESIERRTVGDMAFPLGVYPVEAIEPRQGYREDFEPADGDDAEGDWEEWPDRYMIEVVVSANRLEPLVRNLLALFPARVYPILDVLGNDAYREIDPYISYTLIGLDRVLDELGRFRPLFFEDGLCGFGAMTEQPFLYLFVDEHKIITLRCEPALREKVQKVLDAFDLKELPEPTGADGASHEHRTVLVTPPDRPDLLGVDEIVEVLLDSWRLTLNIDPTLNEDDEGHELGKTPWRCLVRLRVPGSDEPKSYAEVLLWAPDWSTAAETSASKAQDLLSDGLTEDGELRVIVADRMTDESLGEWMSANEGVPRDKVAAEGIISARVLE